MAFVLVDTSVWIDFFRGRLPKELKHALLLLLEGNQVAITDVITHELLVGAAHRKSYDELKELLAPLTEYSVSPNERPDLNRFGFDLKKRGLLGRYADLTVAFLSKQHGAPVLSLDHYFKTLALHGIIRVLEWR